MESCFYTICNPIIVGCKLYQDNLANTPVINGFYSDGTNCFSVSGGTVISISACGPSTISILASNVWIFNISRVGSYSDAKTSATSDTVINSGSQNIGNALDSSNNFKIGRLLSVFDTTSVTNLPTSGTVSFYVTTNGVSTGLGFNNVKPNVSFSPSQIMTTSEWNDWDGSNSNTGVSQSNFVLPSGSVGKKTFTLSSSQLSDIYNNNSFAYYLISNGDLGNVSPTTDSRPMFSSEKGLGISGVGDYELILNY